MYILLLIMKGMLLKDRVCLDIWIKKTNWRQNSVQENLSYNVIIQTRREILIKSRFLLKEQMLISNYVNRKA